jgi:hypothetical protein
VERDENYYLMNQNNRSLGNDELSEREMIIRTTGCEN